MVSPLSKLPKLPNQKDRRGMEYYDAELREKLKSIDEVDDGTTYGKVKNTALDSNEVDLSKAGVKNKTLDNISNTASFEKTSPTQVDYTDYAGVGLDSSGKALNVRGDSPPIRIRLNPFVCFSHNTSYSGDGASIPWENTTAGNVDVEIHYQTNMNATIKINSGSDIGPNQWSHEHATMTANSYGTFVVDIKSSGATVEAIAWICVRTSAAVY